MRIGVLGPVSVDGDTGALTRRDRVVLSALIVGGDGPVSVESLTEALWGADPPASSVKIVQGCVVRLRRMLGAKAIETSPHGYRLSVSGDDIDARGFVRLVRHGEEQLALGQAARSAHAFRTALALWRGPPLAELDGWDPGRIERERLEELHRTAEEQLLDAELRTGRHREVLDDAQRLVDAAPLREVRWGLLARAQYQAGRQTEALQTLHRARVMLSTELGLDPGPQLTTLQRQILQHDADLAVPPGGHEPSALCPYLGLVAYDVADADGFYGRAADVAACIRRLEAAGVLAVVGPSGIGKSSLVRAGLVARLRRDDRDVVVITPGNRPVEALTVLPSSGPPPVLVVDQCEEIVALCDDAEQRAAFARALTEHAARSQLIIALRADWLAELSADPGLAHIIERGLYLLRPMDADGLRAAIAGPAEQAGLLIEPGLIDLLIREVEDEPGALPLLSHALRTTWHRREGTTLTVAGYTAAGGIRGAVGQTAEAVYTDVPPAQRALLRDLLLRLVAQTADGAPVRAQVPRRSLADDAERERLIQLLVAQRLLTADDDVVKLAHEAVTRAWPRLRAWLDDDQVGQRILRHLSVAADTWEQMDRPDSELYRGVRLGQAVEWRDRARPRLTAVEQAFLGASVALTQAEERAVEERSRRQARTNRRLRRLLTGIGVLSVLAVVAGIAAFGQAQRANRSAITADARRIGAQALATDDIDRSLLLAVEGVRLDDSPDTRANLLTALGRSPQLAGVLRADGGGELGTVTVSPDGRTIAVYDDANRLHFYDAASRTVRRTFEADDVAGTATQVTGRAVFHPDGGPTAVAVSTLGPRPVRLLDAETLQELPVQLDGFPGPNLLPWDIAYSPDGTRLAVAFDQYPDRDANVVTGSTVAIWDIDARAEPATVLTDVPRFTHGLAFDPTGRLLYTGTHDAPPLFDSEPAITVYDVDTQTVERTLRVASFPFALSPDGTHIAAASAAPDGPDPTAGTDLVVVDTSTGDELRRLRGHAGQVHDVVFSPDGTHLASASSDRTVALWNVDSGQRVEQFDGHAGDVSSVAFGPDGTTVLSAGTDRAVLLWDLAGDRRFVTIRSTVRDLLGRGEVNRLEQYALPSPSGDMVAYVRPELGPSGTPRTLLQVVDVQRSRTGPATDTRHGAFAIVAWRPDGTRFASTGADGVVRTWDATTMTVIAERRLDLGPLPGLTYLRDDELLVGGFGGPMQRIDAETLQPLAELFVTSAGGPAWTYASPDGRTAAVVTSERVLPGSGNLFQPEDRLLLIDAVAGETLHEVDLGFDGEWADFSPDGRFVAITGRGGQVAVVDVAAGELTGPVVAGHDGNVVSVGYSPDGTLIVSGGVDGRVVLWDGRTGALLGPVQVARPGSATYVGFELDGHKVSIPTWDGVVYAFDTRSSRWIAHACAVAGRSLTPAEWSDAFDDRPYRESCDVGR